MIIKQKPGTKLGSKFSEDHKNKIRLSMLGKRNAWKGGRNKTASGYVILTIDGKHIYEHRHLMEKKLKRKLLQAEIVHHINGIKDDNRLENLMITTSSMNLKIHHQFVRELIAKHKPA